MSIALNISEILFAGIDMSESKRKKMVNEGSIRKITSKIYTPNMVDSLEDIVKRNVFRILGFLFPHAVISHALRGLLARRSRGHSDGCLIICLYVRNLAWNSACENWG